MVPYVVQQFRTERYAALNRVRWDHFLSMGIPLKGKTVFEPGAGIGDQTEWLLSQGVEHIWVNDGRNDNLLAIQERFGWKDGHGEIATIDSRIDYIPGDLESDLPSFKIPFVDLVFCYGVYYHLRDPAPDFRIMRELSRFGEVIVFDYLAGNDNEYYYGYDNPSTSLSQYGFRPRPETMLQAVQDSWGYAYSPKNQLEWQDPLASEQRLVAVGSHFILDNPNLINFRANLT